jgi:GT2 family glycosyltransferase
MAAVNEVNLGFAGNCNAGAARATKDILLFLNQDTRAHEHWFNPLMALFENPKVGIVGPKLIFPPSSDPRRPEGMIQSCGGLYDGGKGPYHRYLGWAEDDWRVNICERVSWTTGAALAIRRELFEKVGGFDIGYEKGYFEDVDLCEQVKAEGYEVWYCPESVFEHGVASTGGIPSHLFKGNSLRFHQKWDAKITPDTTAIYVSY